MQCYRLANEYLFVLVAVQGDAGQQGEAEAILISEGFQCIDRVGSNNYDPKTELVAVDVFLVIAGDGNVSFESKSIFYESLSLPLLSMLFLNLVEKSDSTITLATEYPFNTILTASSFNELCYSVIAISQLIVKPVLVGIDFYDVLSCFPYLRSITQVSVLWVNEVWDETERGRLNQTIENTVKPVIKSADSILVSFICGAGFGLSQWSYVTESIGSYVEEVSSVCLVTGVSESEKLNSKQFMLTLYITQHIKTNQSDFEILECI